MQTNKRYYVGLDIGTDSVGYAVTDEKYDLKKFHGDAAWGSVIFDQASLKEERRKFRSARRRLDRRQNRVFLLQEIFAKEIHKIDERFYIRISESRLWRDDTSNANDKCVLFNDKDYSDKEYYSEYPTIHHLIVELMNNDKCHDIRLVYLACAWLVAHRGHFLSNVDVNNIDEIKNIELVYSAFQRYCTSNGFILPWSDIDVQALGECLKKKDGVNNKVKELTRVLLDGKKASKEISDDFPFSVDGVIRLLAGGTCKPVDIFQKEEYEDLSSITLGMDDEKYAELAAGIGDDYGLIEQLRLLYDWSVLADFLGEASSISEAKVGVYEQHKEDLKVLKMLVRKYCKKQYNDVFRNIGPDNYVGYAHHTDESDRTNFKIKSLEDFSKYIKKILSGIDKVDDCDLDLYNDVMERIDKRTFLPKQKTTDNRVIPHQLYLYELKKILDNARKYLSFLDDSDNDITNYEKIIAIFKYKLPYFVGPLNCSSSFAWVQREKGRITPWNYNNMIDMDESEKSFIKRMTNQCTYLPGEFVVAKDSLCYHRFMVLNEINNIKINGQKISVELKQDIYHQLFEKKKKVKRKDIIGFLIANGYIEKTEGDFAVSGIDEEIKSNLIPQISFKKLMENGILTELEVEDIIERASYSEDKNRLSRWLSKKYSKISDEDRKYICSLRIKDFGRLSRKFLTGLEAPDPETGEAITILSAMWNTNNNLMELLSEKYMFKAAVDDYCNDYYCNSSNKKSLNDRLDDMYISNTVKRPIFRTLAVVDDIQKAFGEPAKIFIEMARGSRDEEKGKRTKTRYQQIIEIYDKCRDEDVRELKHELESMGEYVSNKLQADRLFLYFMQFGLSAYSGKRIELEKLMSGSKEYDIDHIYPQAYVNDDSILNNKVLVLSKENGEKSDTYPISGTVRERMHGIWAHWHKIGTINDEKFRRLTRALPFSDDEKYGFINRQLTETSQSTKAVAQLLKEKFPNTEIVYVKAKLASDFRHEFNIYKSRCFNDLHHAVDAYLNIVVGNVYDARFSKRFFKIDSQYSIKTKTLFTHKVMSGSETIWDPDLMLDKVCKIAKKNTAHFVKYEFYKTGGLFDQNPVKKSGGLVPLKKGLPTEKYGGYNKAGVMFYIPVKYKSGKKNEVIVMSVELLYGKKFLEDEEFAKEYSFIRLEHILGKSVEEVSFPMGMRPWKVNTLLSLDGFRICITGIGSGGKKLLAQPVMQFSVDDYWKYYLKKLESFSDKVSKNSKYIYDKEYDKVSSEDNLKLYDIYIEKLTNTIYRKRINNPVETIKGGRDKFVSLDIIEQAKCLLNIQQIFGRMIGGCDLTAVGGKSNSAATNSFSSNISNWKKNYGDVRIVDQSPAGLWEIRSKNLLELL